MRDITEYGSGSFHRGDLPEGCRRCIQGEKSVGYLTGLCGVHCYYCTIPEDRQADRVFINELPIVDQAQVLQEIDQCLSTGLGITGGDPLRRPQRVLRYIANLKDTYGPDFHIHLYTSGKFLTDELLRDLVDAGLDELRIHPKELKDHTVMTRAKDAKHAYPMLQVGFEVPAIPGKEAQLLAIIEYADNNNLDFVNLNEFEFTETNHDRLITLDFGSEPDNAAVTGSVTTAQAIFASTTTQIPLHFCSSSSKDSIQLVQRFKKRASTIARPFESISDEGELEFGQIWLESDQIDPVIGYLTGEGEVPQELFEVFPDRIETAWLIVDELIDDLRLALQDTGLIRANFTSRHPLPDGPVTWVDPR